MRVNLKEIGLPAGMKSLALSTTFSPSQLKQADRIIPDLSHFRPEFLDW